MVHEVYKALLQTSVLICLITTASMSDAQTGRKLYRYVNEEGVKVLASSIPPQYVAQGYEILNSKGRVIEVVDPRPSDEELKKLQEEENLLAAYEQIAIRYSSVDDILSARDRQLAHLNANISILKGNITNLNNQIDELMKKAAGFERSGKEVPEYIFNNIAEIKAEISSTELLLQKRLIEFDEVNNTFSKEVQLFEQGRNLKEERRLKAAGITKEAPKKKTNTGENKDGKSANYDEGLCNAATKRYEKYSKQLCIKALVPQGKPRCMSESERDNYIAKQKSFMDEFCK